MEGKKPIEYVVLFVVVTVIGAVIGLFLANYIFMLWQGIPMRHYGATTIFKYDAVFGNIPKVAKAIKISLVIIPFSSFVLITIAVIAIFAKPKRELHGSARFANDMEIRKTGFILTPQEQQKKYAKQPSNPSILIGKYKGKFLEFFGNEFMFVAAPTRSGKGVAIVIPNLLHYRDSVVVLDVKNENWDLTAGFRSKYQECYLFSPKAEDGRSHCYNPLDYIDRSEIKRMADIQNIANIFYPADDPKDAFWQNQAQKIFTGLVLYMLETPKRPCTMSELIKLTTPTSMPLHEWIPDTINKRKEIGEGLSVECIEAMMAYVNVDSDNTRSSILATVMSPLNVFTDPMVATATSKSDFRLDEVRKKRMSIYVGIQPNELSRFSKLLNVFFSQLINLNTRVLPEQDDNLKYQCLVLLDEFTALGKVDIIQKAVAYIAGYNMRLMLIFQSKSQVEGVYGKEGAKDIFANMACQVEYTPTEQEAADELSRKLGTQTIKNKSTSRNRGKGGGGSVSTSDQKRELMLPQELKELDANKEIIFFRRTKPILCDKAFYYSSPIFAERMQRLEQPAKGLPIPEKYYPPLLDVYETLRIMRGIELVPPENHKDLQSIEYYQEKHAEFLDQLGKAFGFNNKVMAEIQAIEAKAKAKVALEEQLDNQIFDNTVDEEDVLDIDLSNTDEFDAEFVSKFDEFRF